jgi:predicted nucleotidyltransferase component of viral defense system
MMPLPHPSDAKHKAWLYRTLRSLADNAYISQHLRFKGGTCASLLGILDRFSVDLDFDYIGEKNDISRIQKEMESVFLDIGLSIKDKSKNVPQYFLRYPNKEGERNTIKVDVTFPPPQANTYEARRFEDIDRIWYCQTPETMFANKLVALVDRYNRNTSIAGRDIYDIHYFFENGLRYNEDVIKERTGKEAKDFFVDIIEFIEKKVSDKNIDQDLNTLLASEVFHKKRKFLKSETIFFLRDEIERLQESNT